MKYLFTYTTCSLLVPETIEVIKKYQELKDWNKVRELVIEDNILQKNAISSRKRIFTELKRRINSLTNQELSLITQLGDSQLKYLVFLSILKTYRFIYEFMVEVVLQKYLLFDYKILNSDYESFFESKQLNVEQLNQITDTTKYKLKQVLFRMLEEVQIIDDTKNKIIKKPYLDEELAKVIALDNPNYLKGFLYNDYEINQIKSKL